MDLDETLIALADDTRRSILQRLATGDARVTELAAPFDISLNSVSKHIRLLERAGLVQRRVVGRDHFLSLQREPFDELTEWMQRTREFWSTRLDAFEAALRADDAIEAARKPPAKKNTSHNLKQKEKQMNATVIEPGAIRFERLLPGPVERAWAYIVESDKRAKWFCGGEFDLRVGGKISLEFDNDKLSSDRDRPANHKDDGKGTSVGVITRLEPMRLLAHTWTWKTGDTEVTYELTPKGKDVLLTIVHKRLGTRGAIVSVMTGWDAHTAILEDVLHGKEPRPFWKFFSSLEKEYEAAVPKE